MGTDNKEPKGKNKIVHYAINILSVVIVALLTWYGVSQNTSGVNSEKLNGLTEKVTVVKEDFMKYEARQADFKEDLGKMLNRMDNKLDTLVEGQEKQRRFNKRIAEKNTYLIKSIEDIFGISKICRNYDE